MLKYLIFSLLILTSLHSNAQLQGQALIDSLEAELKVAKDDTIKVYLLYRLSFKYYVINPDKGIEYGEKALEISKEIGWKNGVANSYNSLGNNYEAIGRYDDALQYYSKALMINEEIKNKNGMAIILGDIGNIYYYLSNYPKSLEYYKKALKINEALNNKSGIARNYGNMALIYDLQSDYTSALKYHQNALSINEEIGNKSGISDNLMNIGIIYAIQSDFTNALKYYERAIKINEELGDKLGIADNLVNMGLVYGEQTNYPKALEYYEKALKIYEELGNKSGIGVSLGNLGNIYTIQFDYTKAIECYERALMINKELGVKSSIAVNLANIAALYYELSQDSINIKPDELNQYVSLNKSINLNKSIDYYFEAFRIFSEIGDIFNRSKLLKNLAKAYKLKGDYKKSAEALEKHIMLKDSVFNIDKAKEIATLTATREKEVAEKELEIQKIENIRQRNESYALWGGLALFAIVMFVIYRQRKQSEKLLLNILPAAIAKRLKAKEHPIADHFDNASVVFIDIVGFTTLASDEKAERIVELLNIIFTKFDNIASKYKLEKIKTIGDSYMAVAGVPSPDANNAFKMAKFALEVRETMKGYKIDDDLSIKFRIGIDCGEVVAGVIGEKKFIYDLWGDTVNTAARMESNGTPDEIQVTERFKNKLEDEFTFEERGKLEIKGKGIINTYYLKSEI
jgi:adenylate cyclase